QLWLRALGLGHHGGRPARLFRRPAAGDIGARPIVHEGERVGPLPALQRLLRSPVRGDQWDWRDLLDREPPLRGVAMRTRLGATAIVLLSVWGGRAVAADVAAPGAVPSTVPAASRPAPVAPAPASAI